MFKIYVKIFSLVTIFSMMSCLSMENNQKEPERTTYIDKPIPEKPKNNENKIVKTKIKKTTKSQSKKRQEPVEINLQTAIKKHEIIVDFETYKSKYLSNWYPRKAWGMRAISHKRANKIYSIKSENGNKYLHATTAKDNKTSIAIFQFTHKAHAGSQLKGKWKLNKYPNIEWKWRVTTLPKGANEKYNKKLDSAAAVYVIFKRKNIFFLPWDWQPIHVLHYVWSSSLPKNTIVQKKFNKFGIEVYKGNFVVLQSGKSKKGKWISQKRNVMRDYRRYFGRHASSNPVVVGFHTHSNKTKSLSIADYDDLIISEK